MSTTASSPFNPSLTFLNRKKNLQVSSGDHHDNSVGVISSSNNTVIHHCAVEEFPFHNNKNNNKPHTEMSTNNTSPSSTTSQPQQKTPTSSSPSTSSPSSEETSPQQQSGFHSVSCLSCRKAHRSCNKQLPSCSDCLERKQECVYTAPQKKGRKKGSKNQSSSSKQSKTSPPPVSSGSTTPNKNVSNNRTTSTPSNSSSPENYSDLIPLLNTNMTQSSSVISSSSTRTSSIPSIRSIYAQQANSNSIRKIYHPYVNINQQFAHDSIKRRTIDFYFSAVHVGLGVITKEQTEKLAFEYLTDNINNEQMFGDSYPYKLSSTRNSAKAMLFAMQSVCEQRLGCLDAAQTACTESRRFLALSFDDIDNTYVKMTYGLLGSYMAGEGDDNTAKFYLNSLKYALDNSSGNYLENMNQKEREEHDKLFRIFHVKQGMCSKYKNVDDLNIWDGYMELYTSKTHQKPPEVFNYILSSPPSLQLMTIIDLVMQAMENSPLACQYTESQRKFAAIFKGSAKYAAQIVVLQSIGVREGEIIEKLADQITALSNDESFLLLPCSTLHFFAIGMNVHAVIFPKVQQMIMSKLRSGRDFHSIIEDPYEKNYFDMVLKDIRTLTLFGTRYRRTDKYYRGVLDSLKTIIQWEHNQKLESFNIGPVINLQQQFTQADPFRSSFGLSSMTSQQLDNPKSQSTTIENNNIEKQQQQQIYQPVVMEQVSTTNSISQSSQQAILASFDELFGEDDDFLNIDTNLIDQVVFGNNAQLLS